MKSLIDLTGQKFGEWTVLRLDDTKVTHHAYWICKCSCGNELSISGTSLKQGTSTSCGCMLRWNLAGQRFGRLSVISRQPMRKRYVAGTTNKIKTKSAWLCVCDCGNEVIIDQDSLLSGKTKSCKCLMHEIVRRPHKHGLSRTKIYWRFIANKRRERKKLYDTKWSEIMEIALQVMFPICVNCGNSDRMATDHVLPLSAGYGLVPGNAVRLCIHCNSVKHAQLPDNLPTEFKQRILRAAEKFRLAWSGGF